MLATSLKIVLDSFLSLKKVKREEADDKIAIFIEPLQKNLDAFHESYKQSFLKCMEELDAQKPFEELTSTMIESLESDMTLAADHKHGMIRRVAENLPTFATVAEYLLIPLDPAGPGLPNSNMRGRFITSVQEMRTQAARESSPQLENALRRELRRDLLSLLERIQQKKADADQSLTEERARLRGIGRLK